MIEGGWAELLCSRGTCCGYHVQCSSEARGVLLGRSSDIICFQNHNYLYVHVYMYALFSCNVELSDCVYVYQLISNGPIL